jgi:hypothetical protein
MRTRSNASVSTLETGLGADARIREKLRRKIAPVSQVTLTGWAAKKLQGGAAPQRKGRLHAKLETKKKLKKIGQERVRCRTRGENQTSSVSRG